MPEYDIDVTTPPPKGDSPLGTIDMGPDPHKVLVAGDWRPVVGFEGRYEVSSDGKVRSIDQSGVGSRGRLKFRPGRELSACPAGKSRGHLVVNLGRKQRYVHHLVLEAFAGLRPEGTEARHLDDDPSNNHLDNLAWGTRRENVLDQVRNGIHNNASKTHCLRGHEFSSGNTYIYPSNGRRGCRICKKNRDRRSYLKLKQDRSSL